ncbi:MAG: hypothetical protein ACUVQX_00865 [Candidatus Bathycorpusculaceae bacterium]
MSEFENPIETVVRLLSKNMRVVKEDGSLARILVSREWLDRELFKNCDGQITVGLAESRETKLEMSGRIRRRVISLRVNIWSQDTLMRQKIVEEVNRIVRQNRNKPNETLYTFAGMGQASESHKAYSAGSAIELIPGNAVWTELANEDYEKIWYSDDQRFSKSHNVNGEYALMLFKFKIESRKQAVKKIILAFEGYGLALAENGATIKVWNHATSAWQNAVSGTGGEDETLIITLNATIADFVGEDGCVWLLARTTNASNGSLAAILYCDCVSCMVTVNGIAYLDIVSFRDVDRVDVKPFIYHTEFILKSWSFEDVGGVF